MTWIKYRAIECLTRQGLGVEWSCNEDPRRDLSRPPGWRKAGLTGQDPPWLQRRRPTPCAVFHWIGCTSCGAICERPSESGAQRAASLALRASGHRRQCTAFTIPMPDTAHPRSLGSTRSVNPKKQPATVGAGCPARCTAQLHRRSSCRAAHRSLPEHRAPRSSSKVGLDCTHAMERELGNGGNPDRRFAR